MSAINGTARRWNRWFFLAASVSGLVAACASNSDGTSAPAANGSINNDSTLGTLVGPEGGTVSENGVTITIPAGALTAATKIHVSESTVVPSGYTVSGKVYRFEPAGTHFSNPITIALPSSKPELVYWTVDGSEDVFEPVLTEFDASTSSASVQIAHFSGGFVGASPNGITCVVKQPGACGTQRTTIESPAFWYVDGFFSSWPGTGALATNSIGINRYMNTQTGQGVMLPNADRSVWKVVVQNPSGVPGTAQVAKNTITTFTANAGRGGATSGAPCPGGGMAAPTVEYTCSGGNVAIGDHAPRSDGGAPVTDSGADSGVEDGASTDSSIEDSSADSTVEDSGITGIEDSAIADGGVVDSGVTDSGVVDSGTADSGAPNGIMCSVVKYDGDCEPYLTTVETPKFWYVDGDKGKLASDSVGLNLLQGIGTPRGSPLFFSFSNPPYELYKRSNTELADTGTAYVKNGVITKFTADTYYIPSNPTHCTNLAKPDNFKYTTTVKCSGGNVKILGSKP